MDQFVIEIKPYIDDDTTVYLTNSEAIALEATEDTDLPIVPLKEKVYPTILGSNAPLTEAEYKAKIWERRLWLYMENDDSWEWDDYLAAVRAIIKDSIVGLRRHGIRGYNIDFVLDGDREFYFSCGGGEEIQG
jgi:hypothetical protein